jgi:hypothetical protein
MQQTGKLADGDEGSQAGSYRKEGRKPDRQTIRQVGSKQAVVMPAGMQT